MLTSSQHKTDSEVLREMYNTVIRLDESLNGEDGFIKRTNERLANYSLRLRLLEIATLGAIVTLIKLVFGGH